ncbi:glutathione S-transferase family protein [Corallococcus terminator]|uniref:Glutathione S-transferase family protein n=1 Tax=Corallococcus terminator TaxID=2316733 RepID=A0A3A8IWE6_9BACT|nr:glutathione S-transferase family protein [Corallococcus terminator]RKG84060.1 glutathione S-transferase family protein [Corallococcus terminator]
MKLYFAPRTRATRHRWLLEELEVPYELVKLDLAKQENRTPDYLALNPFGEVPVLVDGDVTLFESSAILLHLADRFPEKHLAPHPGSPERSPYLQWVLFAEVTLEPVVMEHHRDAQRPAEQKMHLEKQHARLDEVLTVIDNRLEGREFAVGNAFTTADLSLASILHLASTLKLLEKHPRLIDYVMRHTKRPATRRAVAG